MTVIKKIIAIVTLSIFSWSCNNINHSEEKETQATGGARHQHIEKMGTLELNKGMKWKADSSTNNNVKTLQAVISKFNASADTSMKGFNIAANELQNGLDKMIKECKISGPDHDALHKWLKPLIEQVKGLKETSTLKEAPSQIEEINKHLQLYTKYFG
ncbi:MAG: hypothetical protein HYX40_02110 [Sphingobacteriales bacterium]|nr:hypothetical protein [Sphingobacteriales bacterium]